VAGILDLRRGEVRRTVWVAAIGFAYAAATTLGDDVAQSIFVSRAGAEALPRTYLLKGLLDVVAAAIYLPLARGRTPGRVLTTTFGIYLAVVIGGRLMVTSGSIASAYALYVGHEAAWTIITIHWGVFVLAAFDASQARRLFPLLFAIATLGRIGAGALLSNAVESVGVADLLWVSVGLAAVAMALSLGRRGGAIAGALLPEDHEAAPPPDDDTERAAHAMTWAWRDVVRSPLVRAIAASTAAMVLVRYGLHMVALDRISAHFAGDEAEIAQFLGTFTAIANCVSITLALFVVPRLLHYFGPRLANLIYAGATLAAYAAVIALPSLLTAAAARFTQQQFKDALKTPLSTLFYGAEPPPMRAPARAFIFGAAIPVATIVASVTFEVAPDWQTVALIGLAGALAFTGACVAQNRRWRRRLVELLSWKLEHTAAPSPERVAAIAELVESDEVARGLASPDPRVRAVAAEVLTETVSRHRAHELLEGVEGLEA
jgi:hypothetical protein